MVENVLPASLRLLPNKRAAATIKTNKSGILNRSGNERRQRSAPTPMGVSRPASGIPEPGPEHKLKQTQSMFSCRSGKAAPLKVQFEGV